LRLLQQAGFDPAVVVSGVDEDGVTTEDPSELVRVLAEHKATAVVARAETPADALVVGCDSMLELGGRVLGKPTSGEEAIERWQRMRGREGVLLTGHCVHDRVRGYGVSAVASTVVRFGTPSDDEIAAYVETGEPLGVAGAFTLDGLSAPFIDGIDGDHGNVIGLSLPLFRRLLAEVGVEVTSLWV
jgi:septum formation protein